MDTPHLPRTAPSIARLPARQHGFSLTEILVTLALAAGLLAIAVPAVSTIGQAMKLHAFASVFVSQLHLARSEAIKRNGRVVMCKADNDTACATSGGWEQGWIVFHDANNNGRRDAGEKLIRRVEALPLNYKLTGNLNVARYVSFASTGGTRLVSGAFQSGTLTICKQSAGSSQARQVVINAVGRPRVVNTTVPSCT